MEKKKILIIDDEQSFTNMVQLALGKTGRYEVRAENKGLNALDTTRRFKPDLILLDIVMPDISGGDIASQLNEDDAIKGIPVIFLTAIVTKDEAQKKDTISGRPCLAKPVGVQELIKAIEENIPK